MSAGEREQRNQASYNRDFSACVLKSLTPRRTAPTRFSEKGPTAVFKGPSAAYKNGFAAQHE